MKSLDHTLDIDEVVVDTSFFDEGILASGHKLI
jgi:hypothetical protein